MANKATPKNTSTQANAAVASATPSRQTKRSQLIKLLSEGAPISVEKLSNALGWQKHTTSAAMTRLKQEGHNLISSKMGNEPRGYQIVSPAGPGTRGANSNKNAATDAAA